jgi:DNA-binding transcriptional MerR regulator
LEEGFRGPQVCNLVGITYRQLDYWARTGLMVPSVQEATGSGSRRRYSYRDVVQLKVIKQLLEAGISLRAARRAVECIRDSNGAELSECSLVMVGASSLLVQSGDAVLDLLKGGQGVLNVLSLGPLEAEIRSAMDRMTPETDGATQTESQDLALEMGLPLAQ